MTALSAREAIYTRIEKGAVGGTSDDVLKLAQAWALLADEGELEEEPPIYQVAPTSFLNIAEGGGMEEVQSPQPIMGFQTAAVHAPSHVQ